MGKASGKGLRIAGPFLLLFKPFVVHETRISSQ